MIIKGIRMLAANGIVAAFYVALTLLLMPLSIGIWQLRLSEGLTMLPLAFPYLVPGLAIGCFVADLLCGAALPDIIAGTAATIAAGVLTGIVGKKCGSVISRKRFALGGLFPVVINTVFVSPVIVYCYMGITEPLYYFVYAFVFALCEAFAVYFFGGIMLFAACKAGNKSLFGKGKL